MPLAAKKKKDAPDPAAMYVAWETFATFGPDLTIGAGTRLRGDHQAVQGWPQFFMPADTPDDAIDAHRRREYAREQTEAVRQSRSQAAQGSERGVQILEAAEPLRDEDAVVAIRTSGQTAMTTGQWIDPTGQIRAILPGEKLPRDHKLVKADPEAFVEVTNGIPRERAAVALQHVSNEDGEGNVRVIYPGQWGDLDDPLVTSNRHVFGRVGFE